jgi:hypothetical protein
LDYIKEKYNLKKLIEEKEGDVEDNIEIQEEKEVIIIFK